ncbi:YeiH family protein [Caulobacter sp. Root1455]|uniref:YeiH family protein n=1 Tax=Caulobacter sp. Root1455 TaxID=1736465 RepID=UPI0009ECB828|nr:putative sulfate exporter family transporter [Caulobacter sp. Root1455]
MASDLQTDAQEAHGLFESLHGMEGLPAQASAARSRGRMAAQLNAVYPGLLAAGTIGLAATWLSQHYGAPVMLFALLIGMAFHFLHEDGRCVAGIEFTSKAVLRVGVALLGAKITLGQILGLGLMPIATVMAGVVTTIGLGFLAARLFGQSRAFGVLSGGAVAICGASAALAIASVLPRRENSERDTILTVVTVTALSTVAMITYPLLVAAVGLDHTRAGVFLGGTIHDVAQVVGAGYTVSSKTGDVATYVKLLRVALLMPVVLGLMLALRGRRAEGEPRARLQPPLFLLGFAALVVVGSLGLLPPVATEAASTVSRWCLVGAVAALGMKTSFGALVKVGWRPVLLIVTETVWIAGLVLVATLVWR